MTSMITHDGGCLCGTFRYQAPAWRLRFGGVFVCSWTTLLSTGSRSTWFKVCRHEATPARLLAHMPSSSRLGAGRGVAAQKSCRIQRSIHT